MLENAETLPQAITTKQTGSQPPKSSFFVSVDLDDDLDRMVAASIQAQMACEALVDTHGIVKELLLPRL